VRGTRRGLPFVRKASTVSGERVRCPTSPPAPAATLSAKSAACGPSAETHARASAESPDLAEVRPRPHRARTLRDASPPRLPRLPQRSGQDSGASLGQARQGLGQGPHPRGRLSRGQRKPSAPAAAAAEVPAADSPDTDQVCSVCLTCVRHVRMYVRASPMYRVDLLGVTATDLPCLEVRGK